MKVGDLVKRKPEWGDWVKHNKRKPEWGDWVKYNIWMLKEEELEIGMVVELDKEYFVVHWPFTGISWEFEDDLEKINDKIN